MLKEAMAATHELFDRANELNHEVEILESMVADLAFDVTEYSKGAANELLEAQASLNDAIGHIRDAAPLLERLNGDG